MAREHNGRFSELATRPKPIATGVCTNTAPASHPRGVADSGMPCVPRPTAADFARLITTSPPDRPGWAPVAVRCFSPTAQVWGWSDIDAIANAQHDYDSGRIELAQRRDPVTGLFVLYRFQRRHPKPRRFPLFGSPIGDRAMRSGTTHSNR